MDIVIRHELQPDDPRGPFYAYVRAILNDDERALYARFGAAPVVIALDALRAQEVFTGGLEMRSGDVRTILGIEQQLVAALRDTVDTWKQSLAFEGERSFYIETPKAPTEDA